MSLANITLPVSHLPRSSSFFLSALQPLGYRYLDHREDRHIGFGVEEPDFWLCQDNPEAQAGAADITFSAPSRTTVDTFYTAALRAGGSSHTPPTQTQDRYRAAVLDLDGNLIEVVWTNTNDRALEDRRSFSGPARSTIGSRVSSWQKDVARSAMNRQSGMAPSRVAARPDPPRATTTPMMPTETKSGGADFSTAKTLIGTLLGAAGGAAVAYAMMRAESEDEMERERAAAREAPTHQITMIDREVDARRSEVGEARSMVSPGIRAPPATPTTVVGGGASKAGSRTPTIQPSVGEQARSAIGTLISTFIPPSSVPRFLEPPPGSSKPSTPAASSVVVSTSTVKPSPPPPRSNTSSSPSAVTAREIPLPPSGTASTVLTARDVPLPASSYSTTTVSMARSIAGTVTPSESISNAGSRRSKKSDFIVGGSGGNKTSSKAGRGPQQKSSPSPSLASAKSEKTIKPASASIVIGRGTGTGSHHSGNGNEGGSTTKSTHLPLQMGGSSASTAGSAGPAASSSAGKRSVVASSPSSVGKQSSLRRRESAD